MRWMAGHLRSAAEAATMEYMNGPRVDSGSPVRRTVPHARQSRGTVVVPCARAREP
jgi:hypothetical protein